MSLLFYQAMVSVVLQPSRKCPSCNREQRIPRERQGDKVGCIYCGAVMPPPSQGR
jgi:ribosomal protein S27E